MLQSRQMFRCASRAREENFGSALLAAKLNTQFSARSSTWIETHLLSHTANGGGDVMERRHFLKLAFGFAAGGVALAASAQAAPLMPAPIADDAKLPADKDVQPAVTTGEEVEQLTPEEVRWGRGRHRGWGRRHWGWRRRHWGWRRRRWRRRYWGWHRRRRRWRRRYWRRRRYYW
jgi:hypothetical protein